MAKTTQFLRFEDQSGNLVVHVGGEFAQVIFLTGIAGESVASVINVDVHLCHALFSSVPECRANFTDRVIQAAFDLLICAREGAAFLFQLRKPPQ